MGIRETFREIFPDKHKEVMSPHAYQRAKANGDLPDVFVGGMMADSGLVDLGPDYDDLVAMPDYRDFGLTAEAAHKILAEEGYEAPRAS